MFSNHIYSFVKNIVKELLYKIFLPLVFISMPILIFSQEKVNDNKNENKDSNSNSRIENLEIPALKPGEEYICHKAYCFSYNEKHEQSNWVAYKLTSEETVGSMERTNTFIPDPMVLSGTATNKDYSKSGYDRGHLAPAADMAWSEQTMFESFYFSNMSPQLPGFNRGLWKSLEEQVRAWAIEYECVYIVTGPILKDGLKTIGKKNTVSIPEYYFKVILDFTEPGVKAIGFIMENKSLDEPLQNYAVSVDDVEKLCDTDFFPSLPDEIEKSIESAIQVELWSW